MKYVKSLKAIALIQPLLFHKWKPRNREVKDLTKSPSALAAHLGLGPRSSGCHLSDPLLFPKASCCIQRRNHFLPGPDSRLLPGGTSRGVQELGAGGVAAQQLPGASRAPGGELRQHLGERIETPARPHQAHSWQGRCFRPPGGIGAGEGI